MIIYLREKGLAQILIGAVTVAFVIGSIFLYGSSDLASNTSPDEVALTVGETKILQSELDRAMSNQAAGKQDQEETKKRVIEQYVLRELVKKAMPVQQSEIEQYIASKPDQLSAYRLYQKSGMSNEFEKDIQVQLSYQGIEQLLHHLPIVTDLEIEETYYRENTKAKLKFIRFRHYEYSSLAKVTDEEAKSHFELNKEKYKKSDQINLKYVQIKPEDFVADEQIKAYYEKTKDQYSEVTEVTARHILKKVAEGSSLDEKGKIRQQAAELLEMIKTEVEAGKSFAELAQVHSEGPSASNGGSLGSFGRGKMVKPFETACFDELDIGEISGLVETSFGFHIIKLEDKKVNMQTFDEVKQEIKTLLIKTDASHVSQKLADNLLMDVELDDYETAMGQEAYSSRNLTIQETGLFEQDASSIPNIGSRYTYGDLIEKAFDMEVNINEMIEVKRSNGEVESYFVALVLEKKAAAIPEFEDVKAEVKNDLQEEKAKELAMEDANKLFKLLRSGQSLDDLVLSYSTPENASIKEKKVEESGLFSLSINSIYVSNMGSCQDAMFKAFQMDMNEVAGPFEGDVAHYLIQLVEKDEADMEKLKTDPKVRREIMKKLVQAKKNEVFTNWYNSTRKQITVTDHRS
ncbi:peptidylprolyl isomerase [Candidatus Poribacteria bacterium]|nr:peptidylprolyl isomerase [Candidatus Poribacteria bacterium]